MLHIYSRFRTGKKIIGVSGIMREKGKRFFLKMAGWCVAWNSTDWSSERHRGIATNDGAAISVFLHGDSSSFVSVQSTVGGVAVSCGTKQHRQNL